VNRAALAFAGVREEHVMGRKFWLTPWWSHSRKLMTTLRNAVKEAASGRLMRFEATHVSSEGCPHHFDFSLKPVPDGDGKVSFLIAEGRDITDRKAAEEALKRREEELQFKTRNLEEANIALRALARHIEENRQELEKNIVLNLRTLVFPYIEKMQRSNLSIRQKMFMEIIEKNLNDVISPFVRAIGHFDLTPTEMHIAGLIRDGRKTKEIAESLHISRRAVEVHRYNIRKKLKINRSTHNLCAFLRSLSR
jgi:PAS domain S-box-containing protein